MADAGSCRRHARRRGVAETCWSEVTRAGVVVSPRWRSGCGRIVAASRTNEDERRKAPYQHGGIVMVSDCDARPEDELGIAEMVGGGWTVGASWARPHGRREQEPSSPRSRGRRWGGLASEKNFEDADGCFFLEAHGRVRWRRARTLGTGQRQGEPRERKQQRSAARG
jgi:hypothetical protein